MTNEKPKRHKSRYEIQDGDGKLLFGMLAGKMDLATKEQIEDHLAVVFHNPFADIPISEKIWGDVPQMVRRGEKMEWLSGKVPSFLRND